MTEKRFTIVNMGLDGKYITEDGKLMEIDRVVDLLNENDQLKQTNQELYDELQETMSYKSLKMGEVSILEKENEQLRKKNKELKKSIEEYVGINKENELLFEINNGLGKENEQLKQSLDELRTYDKEEFKEAEQINTIYKKEGFCGVIEYAKDKLQYFGAVREVEKGLWVMATGGWSDNEHWLNCLNNPVSLFGMKHYCAYTRGGAFYYTEKPHANIAVILEEQELK